MAKRGHRSPYRIRYRWAHGITGAMVLDDLEVVAIRLRELEANADRRDTTVTATVVEVTPDGTRKTLSTHTFTPKD